MKIDDRQLHKFLGWNTQGDLGPFTFYTDRRKGLVFYLKAPPHKPPSPFQTRQRKLITDAAALWNAFSPDLKPNWERACKRLSLPITGYNLFTWYIAKHDDQVIATIERQSALHLLPDP